LASRFELRHLVLVRAPVELEQRLALLHWHIFFDQHFSHEGRFGQARNELNSTLHDRGVRGVRRDKPQANEKDEKKVRKNQGKAEAPSGGEPEQLELEENEPEDREANSEYENCRGHDGRLLSDACSASGTGASPLRRLIIAAVSRRSSSGK
jgi:hypothetical protein